jgi:hypothetical protein
VDNIRWVAQTEAPPLAQVDLPVTFDDPGVDYTVIDFGGASTLVGADPDDAGNSVAITTKGAGAETFAGTVVGTGSGFANPIPFTATETQMSVLVRSPAAGIPVLLKVENADASIFAEVFATTTQADTWERLVFDFSTVGIDPSVSFVQAIIFFDFGQVGAGDTYYWDDLRFGAAAPPVLSQIDLPVTFEDPTVDYTLIDFGGAGTGLGVDPQDAGNTVAITTKGAGAQTFAGTVMGTGTGFANPIPFSAGSTEMRVRVLSPAANVPVLLKVENADASIFSEVLVNTTQANTWETLSFDFSTVGIDPSVTFVQAIIFFDFGQVGTGATYYWDDVQFVNPPPQAKIVFDDAVDPTWDVGIGGADDSSGFALYTDGTNPANKSNWAIIPADDPTRGQVIDVTFNDTTVFGVWFIQSSSGVNMSDYANGSLEFDIRVLSYGTNTSGMTMKVDCIFPCTSGDQPIGVVGAGGLWETVSVPVSQLVNGGLALSTVNTGLVIFPNFGQQEGGINFRLDNIRWVP